MGINDNNNNNSRRETYSGSEQADKLYSKKHYIKPAGRGS